MKITIQNLTNDKNGQFTENKIQVVKGMKIKKTKMLLSIL